ncbi:MAG TPA: phosphatase PAP2 family protein [Solirubrobacteraceae bacterium]|nr:phosphatase PAP2 family protein [Solirubrobacteraceae bacterium]
MGVAHLADPAPFVIGGILLATVALLRRRYLMAALVPVILVGANATTQVLQTALADVRLIELYGVGTVYPGSWPSGHATAAMSLALCLVLVVGPQVRALAAVAGAAFAIAVGYALVALGWHLPSDIVGGYLIAATFTLLGAAALARLEADRPERARGAPAAALVPMRALAAGTAAVLALGATVVLVEAPGMTLDALEHPTAIAAGVAIAALGLTLTSGLALALRR